MASLPERAAQARQQAADRGICSEEAKKELERAIEDLEACLERHP